MRNKLWQDQVVEAEAAALEAALSAAALAEVEARAALAEDTDADLTALMDIGTDITARECTFSFRFSDLVIIMAAAFSAFS